MQRGSRSGGGGSRRPPPTAPPSRREPLPPNRPSPKSGSPGGYHDRNRGPGIGSTIAGSFLGSVLGTVLGNAISSKMYEGRNLETGAWEDPSRPDTNPCKKELDYYIDCAKYSIDQSYCKSAGQSLKACADKHKDYFEGPE